WSENGTAGRPWSRVLRSWWLRSAREAPHRPAPQCARARTASANARGKSQGGTLKAVRPLALILLGLALASALAGCATSPADVEATRKAWAERDAESAAECQRKGFRFVAGGCAGGGGP